MFSHKVHSHALLTPHTHMIVLSLYCGCVFPMILFEIYHQHRALHPEQAEQEEPPQPWQVLRARTVSRVECLGASELQLQGLQGLQSLPRVQEWLQPEKQQRPWQLSG